MDKSGIFWTHGPKNEKKIWCEQELNPTTGSPTWLLNNTYQINNLLKEVEMSLLDNTCQWILELNLMSHLPSFSCKYGTRTQACDDHTMEIAATTSMAHTKHRKATFSLPKNSKRTATIQEAIRGLSKNGLCAKVVQSDGSYSVSPLRAKKHWFAKKVLTTDAAWQRKKCLHKKFTAF